MMTFTGEDSPRVGDQVFMGNELLAEIARQAPGLPPMWRYLPAGTTGRLLGWRGEARAIVDIDDVDRRLVVYVSANHVTRARMSSQAA
jgi:hypothetical protein